MLPLRKIVLGLLRRFNPGDVRIKHHWTGLPFHLHSFKHKSYWFHGRRREQTVMTAFQKIIQPGDLVWEIGGHVGYLTQWFAHLVGPTGKVDVFEPGPNNLRYLEKNVGSLPAVTIYPHAVSDSIGSATFFLEDISGQNNSLVDHLPVLAANAKNAGVVPSIETIVVPTTTLDQFIVDTQRAPDFIKIDVEGVEAKVLQGAIKCLEQSRPVLLIELMHDIDQSLEILRKTNYSCVYPDGLAFDKAHLETQLFVNVFAFPNESPRLTRFLDGSET